MIGIFNTIGYGITSNFGLRAMQFRRNDDKEHKEEEAFDKVVKIIIKHNKGWEYTPGELEAAVSEFIKYSTDVERPVELLYDMENYHFFSSEEKQKEYASCCASLSTVRKKNAIPRF
jgi:hypothetical protein